MFLPKDFGNRTHYSVNEKGPKVHALILGNGGTFLDDTFPGLLFMRTILHLIISFRKVAGDFGTKETL